MSYGLDTLVLDNVTLSVSVDDVENVLFPVYLVDYHTNTFATNNKSKMRRLNLAKLYGPNYKENFNALVSNIFHPNKGSSVPTVLTAV